MKLRIVVALLVLALFVPSLARLTAECPVKSYDIDEIAKAVHDAPSCSASLAIFERCGSGATSDVTVGEIVPSENARPCSKASSLSPANAPTTSAQTVCEKKYIKQTGSMYRSFEAFCYASAAASVAKQFSKAKPATSAKK